MPEGKRTLPEFKFPPVIETVLGVQFSPLKKFSILHCGMFWEKVRKDYPEYSVQPPLEQAFEKFTPPSTKEIKLGLQVVVSPPLRCWLVDKTSTRLVQIQPDRFIINWREVTGEEVYIRYDTFKPMFEQEWNRFSQFLESEGFPRPEINQCEVTYVNHIELNDDIKSYGEVHKIFNFWSHLQQESFLPEPEAVSFNTKYVMPEEKGRLHVTLEPRIRKRDGKEVLQLNLVARGKPTSSHLEDITTWFDLGREWIVRGFTDLTTEKMHKLWERTL